MQCCRGEVQVIEAWSTAPLLRLIEPGPMLRPELSQTLRYLSLITSCGCSKIPRRRTELADRGGFVNGSTHDRIGFASQHLRYRREQEAISITFHLMLDPSSARLESGV